MEFNQIDRKERTVYVTGIHPGCDESQIYELFNKTGSVEKVVLHLTEEGNPHYCLVVYKDPESVMFTIAHLNGHRLLGQAMNLRPLRESSHAAVLQRAITRRRNPLSSASSLPAPQSPPLSHPFHSSYPHHPPVARAEGGGQATGPGGAAPKGPRNKSLSSPPPDLFSPTNSFSNFDPPHAPHHLPHSPAASPFAHKPLFGGGAHHHGGGGGGHGPGGGSGTFGALSSPAPPLFGGPRRFGGGGWGGYGGTWAGHPGSPGSAGLGGSGGSGGSGSYGGSGNFGASGSYGGSNSFLHH